MEFSVLMPVYINELPDNLSKSLESILVNQSVLPSEVVIVKDGPITNELNEVLDRYYKLFPILFKIYELRENRGMGYAMNFGLHKCKYDWIFRMDSDDISRPDRFKKQLQIIETKNYDVIGSSISEFNKFPGDIRQFRVLPEEHPDIIKLMKYRNPINHMSVAFNKHKAILAGGYWEKRYFEDYNLWYEMSKVGAKFYNIQEVLVDARIGNRMLHRRSGYKYFLLELELLKKFLFDGFLGFNLFLVYIIAKLLVRLSPIFLLNILYKTFLRSHGIEKYK